MIRAFGKIVKGVGISFVDALFGAGFHIALREGIIEYFNEGKWGL